MRYPLIIHHDEGSAYGVTVPDIPGCFSAGDTLNEALENVEEAISGHLDILVEDGENIPYATSIDNYAAIAKEEAAILSVVDIDITKYLGNATKINITLPRNLIEKIDQAVSTNPSYKSRSAFLAMSALDELNIAF